MIYDLGGGTFDATLVELSDGRVTVIAEGEEHEAGNKVDSAGFPAVMGDGGGLQHAPYIEYAHAELGNQKSRNGNDGRLFLCHFFYLNSDAIGR